MYVCACVCGLCECRAAFRVRTPALSLIVFSLGLSLPSSRPSMASKRVSMRLRGACSSPSNGTTKVIVPVSRIQPTTDCTVACPTLVHLGRQKTNMIGSSPLRRGNPCPAEFRLQQNSVFYSAPPSLSFSRRSRQLFCGCTPFFYLSPAKRETRKRKKKEGQVTLTWRPDIRRHRAAVADSARHFPRMIPVFLGHNRI